MPNPKIDGDGLGATPATRRSMRYGNPCKGCGVQIAEGTEYCATCIDRRGKAPKSSINLNPQKRPPYEKRHTRNEG